MKDYVLKCMLQAFMWSAILLILNFVMSDILPLQLQMPIRLPINWALVSIEYVRYWCFSFFVLFVIEAIKTMRK